MVDFDPALVSEHVRSLRRALAERNGVPDDVWCFPRSTWNREPPPLDHVEVSAWDLGSADEPWTMFCTNGMSDPPPSVAAKQPPTELMISLPVPTTRDATHRVSMWLAVMTFSPFVSDRAYSALDLVALATAPADVPELAGFDALALVDRSVSGVDPVVIDRVSVEILALTPVSKALADVRRRQGVEPFRSVLLANQR